MTTPEQIASMLEARAVREEADAVRVDADESLTPDGRRLNRAMRLHADRVLRELATEIAALPAEPVGELEEACAWLDERTWGGELRFGQGQAPVGASLLATARCLGWKPTPRPAPAPDAEVLRAVMAAAVAKIWETYSKEHGQWPASRCETCEGEGSFEEGDDCDDCSGEGFIDHTPEQIAASIDVADVLARRGGK